MNRKRICLRFAARKHLKGLRLMRAHNYCDLVGRKFGRLTVVSEIPKFSSDGHTRWLCKCECGNTKDIDRTHLIQGKTKSCGCLRREMGAAKGNQNKNNGCLPKHETHGLCRTRLHTIWSNMKTRCYNSNNRAFKWYGAVGIKICDEWLNDFGYFYKWAIDNGYNDNLTIDRIDPFGNYCPENCRWITRAEQRKTTRRYVLNHGFNE